jgi:tetratricopeptide (TPR) repeat protein
MSETESSAARAARSERAARRAARRRTVVIWCSIPLLLVLVFVGGKRFYHWAKARRADQIAAAGDDFTKAEKWNEAAQKYRAALQLDPLGYRPLSGAARLATKLGRPEAVDLWEQVARLPQATAADRQEYADVLLKLGRLKIAETIIDPLLKSDPDTRTLELAARYSRQKGDDQKALEFARLAVKRAPNDDFARFHLAGLLAGSTDAAQHEEARKILWELAGREGPSRLSATEALASASELSKEDQKRVLEMLEALSPSNIKDALLAADLRIQLRVEDADRIYDQTVARWNAGQTADLIELARWLNLHQQPERVLSLFSIERAFQDNQLLLSRLDALAILQRWNDIDNLLAHPDLTLDPSVLESFRARTAQERNATLDSEVHWSHALSLAAADPSKLRFVANFAEQSHATAVALKAYDQLAKFPEHAAFAYRGTQRLSAQTGELSVQRAAAEKISTLNPDDPNAADQLAYLNLLMGSDIDKNAANARKLAEKYPDRLSFRVTAALGFLRQHDPGLALAQFKGPPIEWQKAPPAWRAVYAATLLANDQADAAREIIATIPRDKLSPEERTLIQPK